MNNFHQLIEQQVISFEFFEDRQQIEVVRKKPHNSILAVYCPNGCPDTIWKEIYGIVEGKLVLIERINGTHIPAHFVQEQYKFENEK